MSDLTRSTKAIALRIAQALEDEWPNLCIEGYDVDEAMVIIEQQIPMSVAEAEAEMASLHDDDDLDDIAPSVPVVNPTIQTFRDALGVEKMSIIDCIKTAAERISELTNERDMYRKLFESALSHVDRVFQLCAENPEPILPDFAILGEDKFCAVVRLAEDYKRLRAALYEIYMVEHTLSDGRTSHAIENHRRWKIAIAQRLEDEWPYLSIEGYDVDEATDLIEQLIPMTAAEAEMEMAELHDENDLDDIPPSPPVENPTLRAFRDAVGVVKMPLIQAIVNATEQLTSHKQKLAAVREKLQQIVNVIDSTDTYFVDMTDSEMAESVIAELWEIVK